MREYVLTPIIPHFLSRKVRMNLTEWATINYVEQSRDVSLKYIEIYYQRNGELYYYAPFASKGKGVECKL